MTERIRLIALDLDGTLLTTEKELTARTRAALLAAAEAGIEIVPATGRFYGAVPEAVRSLPGLRYAITINGAEVCDLLTGSAVYRAEIPREEALDIMSYLDGLPVAYDCYSGDLAFMTQDMKERIEEYVASRHYLKMIRDLRRPVPELKAHLRALGADVQKIQVFTRDRALRAELLTTLEARFPALAVTSSVPDNVEINAERANKGDALLALAAHLGIAPAETAAFGDGLNDVHMLRAAGLGVAMGNAEEAVKAAADAVTASCDEDGVAAVLEDLLGSMC